jgi:hypothetical protein
MPELTSPELERQLGEAIRKRAQEIVDGLIDKAIEGGAVQAKFLFDFAGLNASPPPEQKGESLLELMRRELELEEPPEGTVE